MFPIYNITVANISNISYYRKYIIKTNMFTSYNISIQIIFNTLIAKYYNKTFQIYTMCQNLKRINTLSILQLTMQQYIYFSPKFFNFRSIHIYDLILSASTSTRSQKYWSSMSLLFNRVSLPPFDILSPFLFLLLSTRPSIIHLTLSLSLSRSSSSQNASPLKFPTLHINAGA